MTEDERDLLIAVARILLATHNSSGPDAVKERKLLREALSKVEIKSSVVERLWNPFQTCSTLDNKPVELKFPGGGVHLGYFSSSQGRWVHADGIPFPEGTYPSHWRSPQVTEGARHD